jgi:hypothetical protein
LLKGMSFICAQDLDKSVVFLLEIAFGRFYQSMSMQYACPHWRDPARNYSSCMLLLAMILLLPGTWAQKYTAVVCAQLNVHMPRPNGDATARYRWTVQRLLGGTFMPAASTLTSNTQTAATAERLFRKGLARSVPGFRPVAQSHGPGPARVHLSFEFCVVLRFK